MRIPEVADLACVGAAMLAGMGCGLFADQHEALRCLKVKVRTIQPDLQKTENYRTLFAEYKRQAEILGKQ